MGWEYTDEQQGVMGQAGSYGERYNPLYGKDQKLYKAYQRGDDRKGKLTKFLAPMRVAAGVRRENAVEDYNNAMAPAFNQGGGALTAAADARLRREYDQDLGQAEVSGYVQHGEQLHDNVIQGFESEEDRRLRALGIQAGVAGGGPHQTSSFWGDLFKGLIGGASYSKSAGLGFGG